MLCDIMCADRALSLDSKVNSRYLRCFSLVCISAFKVLNLINKQTNK